jgi:hypothetical protein
VFVFGPAALTYTYSSGLSQYNGTFAQDAPVETILAQYLKCNPTLEFAVAIVLQAEARKLLPTSEQLQILVPMFTLLKHAQHLERGNPAVGTLMAAADILRQEFTREKPDFFAQVEAQAEVLKRVSKHFRDANSRSLNKLTLDVLNRFRLVEDAAETEAAASPYFKSPFVLPPPLPSRVLNMLYSTSPLINILPPSFGVFGADVTAAFGAVPPMRQISQQASYTTL